MRIYFAGSIRAGREDAGLYHRIIGHLQKYGEVLTEHVGDRSLTEMDDEGVTDRFIHDRDMGWLLSADVVVAEVTVPSLGVGYEIGRALENGKPVLCLYRPQKDKRLSAMISGCEKVIVSAYQTIYEAESIIDNFF